MRIDRLMLHDFKSFRAAELNLGSVTLLVGANASGKSNVRDAFRFLHGVGLGYSLAEVIGEKYGPGGLLVWQGIRGGGREIARFGASGFSLKADGQDGGALYTYRIEVEMLSAGTGVRLVQDQPQIAVENEVRWQAGSTQVRTLPNDPDIKVWRQALQSFRFLDLHPDAMRLASQPGQYVLNPGVIRNPVTSIVPAPTPDGFLTLEIH
ncbi:MAG: AAA family ATPase [bacterium]